MSTETGTFDDSVGLLSRNVRKTQDELAKALLGKAAPKRRRRKRVAKKIAQRCGAMHYDGLLRCTMGKLSAWVDRWTP